MPMPPAIIVMLLSWTCMPADCWPPMPTVEPVIVLLWISAVPGSPPPPKLKMAIAAGVARDVADHVVVDVELGQVGVALNAAAEEIAHGVVVDFQPGERIGGVRGQDAIAVGRVALDREAGHFDVADADFNNDRIEPRRIHDGVCDGVASRAARRKSSPQIERLVDA